MGFFCFSFNKRSAKDADRKTEFFCICFSLEMKRKPTKRNKGQCLLHKNKSVYEKLVQLCGKNGKVIHTPLSCIALHLSLLNSMFGLVVNII